MSDLFFIDTDETLLVHCAIFDLDRLSTMLNDVASEVESCHLRHLKTCHGRFLYTPNTQLTLWSVIRAEQEILDRIMPDEPHLAGVAQTKETLLDMRAV